MDRVSQPHKHIVAAFLLAVGFSILSPDFAAADEARVDELFAELQTADEQTSQFLIEQITTEWSKSGSPAIDLLLQRGIDAMAAGDPARAVEHYTAAIDHAPDFAEAYNARAEAYYMTDDIGPALQDLGKALELNPEHFGATLGFAMILEELGRPQDALDLYRQVLAILPQDAAVADAVKRLSITLEGQTL
jgi:tetratricopeptide (TPR) repeat protein